MKITSFFRAMAAALGASLSGVSGAAVFTPNDVLMCPATADIVDPEIEPGGTRVVYNTTAGELRVMNLRPDGSLGLAGCLGVLIDTDVVTRMPDIPFGQGAEWARSQNGVEIVYTKAMPDGSTSMWRSWQNGNLWEKAMMTSGESRGMPMPSADATDSVYRLKYLRRLASGAHVPMWRESEQPGTETAWAAEGNSNTAGVPRWVPGRRALSTVVTDAEGFPQAALYWLDSRSFEVMTSDASSKDEVWMWQAPEFGGEYVFVAIVDGCCLKVYRKLGESWTVVNELRAPDFAGKPQVFSPEPWVYNGRSYLAVQVGLSKSSRSDIWVLAVDPANPLARQVSDTSVDTVRYEPEWFNTVGGPVVYFSQYTSRTGKSSWRRAATGIR